jgi:cathepsin C
MLESRFKIKYEKKLKNVYKNLNDFKISLDHVLECSIYNQGCDGGYSYLVSKFFYQFEIIPETCYDKSIKSCHQTCKDRNLNSLSLSVKDFYYVGGAYGKTNEENLMQDLYTNGPVVISLEPEYSFMVYKSGIYDFNKENWMTQNSSKPQWQKVDHSVLLVGWGVEVANGKEIKYWLLQNSWGTHWGEGGYMRFKRGVDLLSIESIGEAAIPHLE